MILWNVILSVMGVLVAFPMKRRFINDEQQPFPEGRACGVVLDTLYSGAAAVGVMKVKALVIAGAIAGFVHLLIGEAYMQFLQVRIMGLKSYVHLNDKLDAWFYKLCERNGWRTPHIMGTDIRELALRPVLDIGMLGVGGLMGTRTSNSVMLGSMINFLILAPWMIRRGDIVARIGADGSPLPFIRADIVNQWSLWWAVVMMVVGSLVALFAKPKVIFGAFRGLLGPKQKGTDVLGHIELPLKVSFIGVPICIVLATWMAHEFFGVKWYLALLAVPLILVLTLICTNAMALTSWTPTGALSKITQFTFGSIERINPATNLMTAGMTAEVASNAANLLSDIKPGYMLGGKPRQQALGHCIGIVSGAIASTPLFYVLFMPDSDPGPGVTRDVAGMVTDKFSMPAAMQWKGVADIIAKGFGGLPVSAQIAAGAAAVVALAFEIFRIMTKGKFPLSPVAIGLGVVLPPDACFSMWLGAMFFWLMSKRYKTPGTKGHALWVDSVEPICAGLIAAWALVGIGDKLVEVFLL